MMLTFSQQTPFNQFPRHATSSLAGLVWISPFPRGEHELSAYFRAIAFCPIKLAEGRKQSGG
jgi:hypothetical protein